MSKVRLSCEKMKLIIALLDDIAVTSSQLLDSSASECVNVRFFSYCITRDVSKLLKLLEVSNVSSSSQEAQVRQSEEQEALSSHCSVCES